MKKVNNIFKIRYTLSTFSFTAKGFQFRRVYELYSDGKVTYSFFDKGSRKALGKLETHEATAADFAEMCEVLNACIESADTVKMYVDDSSGEVRIYRYPGRVETMDRGFGNEEIDVCTIIHRYISAKAGIEL